MVDIFSTNGAIQTDYLPTTDFPPPGAAWRGSHGQVNELFDSACGDMRTLAKGVFKITNTANTNAEAWKVNYDGVLIPFTTGASAALTMAALNTALLTVFGPDKALEEDVTGIVLSSPDVTISFADGTTHTISLVAPGGAASTFTAAYTTTPSAPVDHLPGMWVAIDASGYDPQLVRVKQPGSASDVIYGLTTNECVHPTGDTHPSLPGGSADAWPAGRPLTVWRRGQAIGRAKGAVDKAYIGKPVFAVFSGKDKGKSMVSSGGTSQVTRGDVEYNGTDNVGLAVDSLPNLFVPSNTSDDQTAIDLSVKWNGSAEHAAVATATYDNSGAPSYIVLTFKDFAAHTVTAYSPATADITSITNTTDAVAAIAVQTNSTFMTPAADGEGVAINVTQG